MLRYLPILLFTLFTLIISCTQLNKQQEEIPFSNDYLIGQYSSQENGEVELRIINKGNEIVLQQLMENKEWSVEEKLTPVPDEKIRENFGPIWKNKVSAALSSGICDYYRLRQQTTTEKEVKEETLPSEYISYCFAVNYLYKVD